jgi:hypothetical protein
VLQLRALVIAIICSRCMYGNVDSQMLWDTRGCVSLHCKSTCSHVLLTQTRLLNQSVYIQVGGVEPKGRCALGHTRPF